MSYIRLVSKLPYRHHIVVHPLELLLCGVKGVWRRVEFIGFEALLGELYLERLVILLTNAIASAHADDIKFNIEADFIIINLAHPPSRRATKLHR